MKQLMKTRQFQKLHDRRPGTEKGQFAACLGSAFLQADKNAKPRGIQKLEGIAVNVGVFVSRREGLGQFSFDAGRLRGGKLREILNDQGVRDRTSYTV